MFAIIRSGGKQYKVTENSIIKIEKVNENIGENIDFDQVLMLKKDEEEIQVGSPTLKGAKVTAEVLNQGRHRKISIIKFRRRKHSMRRQGHRQYYTEIKVKTIQG
jgi:large subunit ribosomal protein L21